MSGTILPRSSTALMPPHAFSTAGTLESPRGPSLGNSCELRLVPGLLRPPSWFPSLRRIKHEHRERRRTDARANNVRNERRLPAPPSAYQPAGGRAAQRELRASSFAFRWTLQLPTSERSKLPRNVDVESLRQAPCRLGDTESC
jgi:hypothetical protein